MNSEESLSRLTDQIKLLVLGFPGRFFFGRPVWPSCDAIPRRLDERSEAVVLASQATKGAFNSVCKQAEELERYTSG